MNQLFYSSDAGLIQDVMLLSSWCLFGLALTMLAALRLTDHLAIRRRRKAMAGKLRLPAIE